MTETYTVRATRCDDPTAVRAVARGLSAEEAERLVFVKLLYSPTKGGAERLDVVPDLPGVTPAEFW